MAIAAGDRHTVGLKADGTVVATRFAADREKYDGQCEVSGWKDIVAIAAGRRHTVGLREDGTVVATEFIGEKENQYGQCDVSSWRDIIAIAAGDNHTVGLKADGTLVATGQNKYGQCEVAGWKLFSDYKMLKEEREEQTHFTQQWRNAGLCQHCGGEFKGFFSKKCADCGRPKDY